MCKFSVVTHDIVSYNYTFKGIITIIDKHFIPFNELTQVDLSQKSEVDLRFVRELDFFPMIYKILELRIFIFKLFCVTL